MLARELLVLALQFHQRAPRAPRRRHAPVDPVPQRAPRRLPLGCGAQSARAPRSLAQTSTQATQLGTLHTGRPAKRVSRTVQVGDVATPAVPRLGQRAAQEKVCRLAHLLLAAPARKQAAEQRAGTAISACTHKHSATARRPPETSWCCAHLPSSTNSAQRFHAAPTASCRMRAAATPSRCVWRSRTASRARHAPRHVVTSCASRRPSISSAHAFCLRRSTPQPTPRHGAGRRHALPLRQASPQSGPFPALTVLGGAPGGAKSAAARAARGARRTSRRCRRSHAPVPQTAATLPSTSARGRLQRTQAHHMSHSLPAQGCVVSQLREVLRHAAYAPAGPCRARRPARA